jgi:hypothetical protein
VTADRSSVACQVDASATLPAANELAWPVAGREARALVSGEKTSHRIPVFVPSDMLTPDGDTWLQDVDNRYAIVSLPW